MLKAGMKMMKAKKRHMHRPGLRILLIAGAITAALAGLSVLIGKKAMR